MKPYPLALRRGSEAPGNRSLHFPSRFVCGHGVLRLGSRHGRRPDPLRRAGAGCAARARAKVLTEVAQTGLPGEHHFFITFNTRYPGVRMSKRLSAEYPERDDGRAAAPVLGSDGHRIGLRGRAFVQGRAGEAARALRAISSFVDPHASFALKFDLRRTRSEPGRRTELGGYCRPNSSRAGQGCRRRQEADAARNAAGGKQQKAKDGEAAAASRSTRSGRRTADVTLSFRYHSA